MCFPLAAKRPDQPTLGHHSNSSSQVKKNSRYRQGYHYYPITSTAQSPTFVLSEEEAKALPGPSTSRPASENA